MDENRAAVLRAAGDLSIEPRALPQPGPREVVIAVASVGVCGSDVHYYEHGRIGNLVVEAPLVLGHEASGVVVRLGEAANRHQVGSRVAIEPGVPCASCTQCRDGAYNLCPHMRFLATPPIDGAFTRFLAIAEDFAYPLPDELSDDAGALLEPLSVGIWASRKAGVGLGSRVLVTGAGPIGNLAAQVARAAGAEWVGVLDVNQDRLEVAAAVGIADLLDARAPLDLGRYEPTVLLECTGVESVVRAGISALQPRGRAVLVGMCPDPEQSLPVAQIQSRELMVTGTFRYAHTYPAAIALAVSGRVKLDDLVGARIPLEETERALRMSRTNPAVVKTIVTVS